MLVQRLIYQYDFPKHQIVEFVVAEFLLHFQVYQLHLQFFHQILLNHLILLHIPGNQYITFESKKYVKVKILVEEEDVLRRVIKLDQM